MKLYFKQRFFSWFDSYDIYDYDTGDVVYTVEGQLAWGHCLHILDADGRHIATVKQRVLTFLPKFDLYLGDACIGTISKELLHWTDTYVIDVADGRDGLCALMVVLAIDAEKCSHNS